MSSAVNDAAHAVSSGGEDVSGFVIHHLVNADIWHPVPGVGIPLFGDITVMGVNIGLTLHSLMLIIAAVIVFLLFGVLYKKQHRDAPSGITNLLEVLVLFVRDEICINYMGESDGKKLAPFFLNFFLSRTDNEPDGIDSAVFNRHRQYKCYLGVVPDHTYNDDHRRYCEKRIDRLCPIVPATGRSQTDLHHLISPSR